MTLRFEQWLDDEYAHAAQCMLRSVSACDLVKERAGFGQSVRAAAGSVIASPVLASWDPDPDYFFHWFRDSAIVIDTLRLLYEARDLREQAVRHFADFVHFSSSLAALDGRDLLAQPQWRTGVQPEFVQYLRGEDLATVYGQAVYADVRVNPDGTLDISRWTRPQHDGAPLRALAVRRWLRALEGETAVPPAGLPAGLWTEAERLLRTDLALTVAHWRSPSLDIWEEELGHHYFTLRVSAAALEEGAQWSSAKGEAPEAAALEHEARAIRTQLDAYWDERAGYYRSRSLPGGAVSAKELDMAVILAAIHAEDGREAAHSVHDPRMHATLGRLEALFDRLYAINWERPTGRAPAMGRYEGDVYFSGGAYYFSTLGAAEFCFRAATGYAPGSREALAWCAHGDAYLETVRTFTPPSGDLSEQFDQRTGVQTSAKHLAWSYAAFISCIAARRAVVPRATYA